MGTCYYLTEKPDCQHCGRPFERLHIGKSSAGWCFSLHVIPDLGINTLDDWRAKWAMPGMSIMNEYGDIISISDMELTITARHRGWDFTDRPNWFYPYYDSEEDFHSRNHSERGPNGLVRHAIDGRHCIGHGEGTWDYIIGEFS